MGAAWAAASYCRAMPTRDPLSRKLTLVHSTSSPVAPPTPPPAAERKPKRRRNPPYVNVRPARPEAGKPHPEVRWKDPDSGADCSETVHGSYAKAWARGEAISLDVVKRRGEIKEGKPPTPPLAAYDVLAQAKLFLATLETESDHTRSNYGRYLTIFVSWLTNERRITTLGKITDVVLRDFYLSRKAVLKANGKPRKASSVQAEVKPIRSFLSHTRDEFLDGRGAHFTSDMLRRGLPLKGRKRQARRDSPEQRVLTLPERLDMLRAAMAYDATHTEAEPCAPDFALDLLTGLRRYELTSLQVCDVVFDRKSAWERDMYEHLIALPGAKAKRGVPRPVYFTGFTVLGLELVREMVRGRAPDEYVSALTYDSFLLRCADLREYGAPVFTPKDLRATCCTCESGLTEVTPRLCYERQGHTKEEARDTYERPGASMPRAATLEEVMRCAPEIQLVIELLRARNDLRIVPRNTPRPNTRPKPKGVAVLDCVKPDR